MFNMSAVYGGLRCQQVWPAPTASGVGTHPCEYPDHIGESATGSLALRDDIDASQSAAHGAPAGYAQIKRHLYGVR